MKEILKGAVIATIAMTVIIMVQMALTYVFSFHIGEVFSKVAVSVLFYYCIIRLVQKSKSAAAAE